MPKIYFRNLNHTGPAIAGLDETNEDSERRKIMKNRSCLPIVILTLILGCCLVVGAFAAPAQDADLNPPVAPDYNYPVVVDWQCKYGGPAVQWYAPEYPWYLRYDPLIYVWLDFHSDGARVSYHKKLAYRSRWLDGTHIFWTQGTLENGTYIIDGGTLYNYHVNPPLVLPISPGSVGREWTHSCGSFFPGIWNRDPYPGP